LGDSRIDKSRFGLYHNFIAINLVVSSKDEDMVRLFLEPGPKIDVNRVEKIVRGRHVGRREEISGISNIEEVHILRNKLIAKCKEGHFRLALGEAGKRWWKRLGHSIEVYKL